MMTSGWEIPGFGERVHEGMLHRSTEVEVGAPKDEEETRSGEIILDL